MARIQVDTDLLLKNADALHAAGERFHRYADTLLGKILALGGAYPELQADSRKDAYEAQQLILSVQSRLEIKADTLAALARAFKSIDDETIAALIALRGEGWFQQTFFPSGPQPDLEGYDPYYLPQTRMLLVDWVPVYVLGPNGLSQIDTYQTGRIVGGILGEWTDPKTGKSYYVVDLGGGKFGFIPKEKKSIRLDLSKIPDRDGIFADGQKIPNPDLPPPYGSDTRNPDWYIPGGPWQDLILGKMNIAGLGAATFPLIPHANLCGELSVLFCVGETDLEAGLSKFAQLKGLGYWNIDGTKTEYTGTQVLQNIHHTTSSYDLKRLFEAYGYDASISNSVMPSPEELAEKIQSGHKLVFLTELDTRKEIPSPITGLSIPNPTYGQLVPGAPPSTLGRAAHWVTVTDVFQDGSGSMFVKVFNTFSGSEETYSWDTFVKTCQQPGAQTTGSYTYVEAVKPSSAE
jgi:hypothetical protein